MKKLISLLIGCSLALAGAALAQQPVEQESPTKGKRAPEKARATQAQPGANAARPQERPAKQPGAMKERGATSERGATNEPAAGKARKAPTSQEPAAAPRTDVSGQPAGGATTEPGAGKGRKARAKQESANAPATGTDVSGQPADEATTKPGAEKGRKARAKQEPANAPATGTDVSGQPAGAPKPGAKQQAQERKQGQGVKQPATEAGGTSAAAPQNVQAKAKKPDPQQVQQVKSQHASFRAQPNPQQVPAVTFNQNYRIQGSDRWQGHQYEVFRSYRPEWHDEGWYRSHYARVELIGGGYYFFNNGYWFPAWGYSPSAQYYAYDGPIYVGQRAVPPDQVIADTQALLQQMGYYRGEVDGLLGPLTREALTAYQSDQGLTPTAAIDQPTLDSLGLA
jgi:Putative peptidoglycan binding domain